MIAQLRELGFVEAGSWKFRVEVSRYLSNSHYTGSTGGEAKAWHLLADPTISGGLPVIEVAFLNFPGGVRMTVEFSN